jgi:hypothetical protein
MTSDVAESVNDALEFAEVARVGISEFRNHADTYADEEIMGLARSREQLWSIEL